MHDHCAEHFEVRSGRIAFLLDGEQRVLEAGEQLTVPRGTWHRWWNPGDDEVLARVRVEPALRFEQAIIVFWGLCADGHTNGEGQPSPLFGALLATRYRAELATDSRPTSCRGSLFPPLAALAKRRGLDRMLDRYLDLDTHPTAERGLGRLPERVMRPRAGASQRCVSTPRAVARPRRGRARGW